jgi:PAS domain S-box-containing protein
MENQKEIIKELSSLYELSLCVGRSLDLEENCHFFLQKLIQQKKLVYGAIWLRNDFIEKKTDNKYVRLVLEASNASKKTVEVVDFEDKIIQENNDRKVVRIDKKSIDLGGLFGESAIEKGAFLIFKLGEIGFLKLYAFDEIVFSETEIEKFKNILVAFVDSLKGCVKHQLLVEDQKKREAIQADLENSREKYRLVVQNLSEGLIMTDTEDRIVYVNPQMCDLTGYEEVEMIGEMAYKLLLPEVEWALMEAKMLDREAGKSESYEKLHVRRNGEQWWGNINASPLVNKHGIFEGTLAAVVDITLRKKSEVIQEHLLKELAEKNKDLDDFAYIVSHDLKAPLRGIKSLADWIYEDYSTVLGGDGKEQLDMLRNRVFRLHGFIEGLLEYSRIGRMNMKKESFDLERAVSQVIEMVKPEEDFDIKILTKLPNIYAEKLRIEQVFQNLISNAINYNDKRKGSIEISHEESPTHFLFKVKDNGMGIEQRHFDKVFQIFQTLNTRDTYESTGIGLAIVKKIVTSHKGTIYLESEPTKGTTFIFTIQKNQFNS